RGRYANPGPPATVGRSWLPQPLLDLPYSCCRNLGSSRSRIQSPPRLNASTTTVMARPGKREYHHAEFMYCRPSATIAPQVGVGGGIPAPRKLKIASVMITHPTCRVSITTNVLATLGKMCHAMMQRLEVPIVCEALTKSRSLRLITSPR